MLCKIPTFDDECVTLERWRDPRYGAVFYLFATFMPWAFEFVTYDGVDVPGLLAASDAWDARHRLVARIALSLFNPGCIRDFEHSDVSAGEIAEWLDGVWMRGVVNAMRIARGELTALDQLADEAP